MKRTKKCGTGVSPVFPVSRQRPATSDSLFHPSAVVYIAGPMRGKPKNNFPAFHAMEDLLCWKYGCRVFNPARITDPHVSRYHRGLKGAKLQREYARHDIDLIVNASAVVMLDGWEDSKGATAEYHIAKWIGLDIVTEGDVRLCR